MKFGKVIKKQRHNSIHTENVDHLTIDERKNLLDNGWMEVKFENEKPVIENDVYYEIGEFIELKEGYINGKYVITLKDEKCIKDITFFKQQLSESDYKVIKNMEAQLVNEELPYDSVTLHTERQALRDKINELEELLKNN